MSKTTEVSDQYKNLSELLDNLDIWSNPTKMQEVTARRYIESEIIDYVFGSDTEIQYGPNIDQSEIDAGVFRSTERVRINRVETDDGDMAFSINVKISSIGNEDETSLYFDGYVTKQDGLIQEKPVTIEKSSQ